MWASTPTYATGTATYGGSCPNCGYHLNNCVGHGATAVTVWDSRNWREEDEEVDWPVWWQLITANWLGPNRLFAPLLSIVRLWPQARAPPVALLIS